MQFKYQIFNTKSCICDKIRLHATYHCDYNNIASAARDFSTFLYGLWTLHMNSVMAHSCWRYFGKHLNISGNFKQLKHQSRSNCIGIVQVRRGYSVFTCRFQLQIFESARHNRNEVYKKKTTFSPMTSIKSSFNFKFPSDYWNRNRVSPMALNACQL